jgi:hypothetical protein
MDAKTLAIEDSERDFNLDAQYHYMKQEKPNTLEKISQYVERYQLDRSNLTADQIQEMRAELSTYVFQFIEDYRELSKSSGLAKIELGKIEGMVYMEIFNEENKTKSQSAAETIARKSLLYDQRFITASQNAVEEDAYFKQADKILTIAGQVLNSMAHSK